MANQFVQYPLIIAKTANGGYIVYRQVAAEDRFKYVFPTMADLIDWLYLNESI